MGNQPSRLREAFKYADAVMLFVETVLNAVDAHRTELTREDLNDSCFWQICRTTRNYYCHAALFSLDTDTGQMVSNLYHLYDVLGIQLTKKKTFRKNFQQDIDKIEPGFAPDYLDFLGDVGQVHTVVVSKYRNDIRSDFATRVSGTDADWRFICKLFGYIVHHMVCDKDASWRNKTRQYRNFPQM